MIARLITIPFSHYCEKARWGLEHAGVPFREEGHAPLLHWAATYWNRGRNTVPVLVTEAATLGDSTEILIHADRKAAPGRGLYPTDHAEVLALEERFDLELGPATRRLAYYHLMAAESALVDLVSSGIPRFEAALFRATYPLVVGLMRRHMRIDADGAARSLARVRQLFDEVSARLADGRRWLAADRFTAADLTFAALAAPVIVPPEFGRPLPSAAAIPGEYTDIVDTLRATPAGEFAMRVYREERGRLNQSVVAESTG